MNASNIPSGPVACLPMYDWPELRTDINKFWAAISKRLDEAGIAAPSTLTHTANMLEVLQNPNLVIGQTCGAPYRKHLKGKVTVLGSIAYGGWAPSGYYNSVVCVSLKQKQKDYKTMRLATNSQDSQSGYECLKEIVPAGVSLSEFFPECIVTGSHRASLHKVAAEFADIAAIDSVAWGLAERYDTKDINAVRVIARTELTPGCPIVTAATRSSDECEAIIDAINGAFDDIPDECHEKLGGPDGLAWADFSNSDYE